MGWRPPAIQRGSLSPPTPAVHRGLHQILPHPRDGCAWPHLKYFVRLQFLHAKNDAVAETGDADGPAPVVLESHVFATGAVETVGHAGNCRRSEGVSGSSRLRGHPEAFTNPKSWGAGGALTWRVDGEGFLRDVAGGQAVVQRPCGAGDGHLDALAIEIHHGVDL